MLDIVIISQWYMHMRNNNRILKALIKRLPRTFFIIFIGNKNIIYNAVIPIKSNVIVISKFLAVDDFSKLLPIFRSRKVFSCPYGKTMCTAAIQQD
ncbi:MAG: hypothetical protein ACR5LG_09445 [Sodalis sp. (in: enterobacteria)]|uniref:hypothetical protein n=1 Tax=Sodalis sp. (in: enterobacteria) TaxID=1898979 RepID=UPI003F345336